VLASLSHRHPILLIDDVFGELDPARRNALLTSLPTTSQKLITTTHLDWLDGSFLPDNIWNVSSGSLTPRLPP
jgi:DNA replication and repair protein RecF